MFPLNWTDGKIHLSVKNTKKQKTRKRFEQDHQVLEFFSSLVIIFIERRGGRVVEGGGLENH